jgi:hypothetical protein
LLMVARAPVFSASPTLLPSPGPVLIVGSIVVGVLAPISHSLAEEE